jgi:hypothetical protein
MVKKLAIGLFAILFVFIGCDEDSDCVNCPGTGSATLDNIWPNPDSASWTYNHTFREWDGEFTMYPTLEAVPDDPLPSWSEVFTYLESNVPPAATMTEAGTMTLTFDGETPIAAGLTAQNLVQEVVLGSVTGHSTASSRGRLYGTLGSEGKPRLPGFSPTAPERPLFLHGGAWKKTSSGIVMYGRFNEPPSWIYLPSNLRVGAHFSVQILPDIAPDVVLRGTVYRQITVETEIGTFKEALDCLYILDYGISAAIDLQGEVFGYFRTIGMGRVIYAPTIGPIHSYERLGVEPGDTLSAGLADVTEELVETNALD